MSAILSGKPILHSQGEVVDLASATGTLGVANGGTGKTALVDNRVLTGGATVNDEANLTFNGTTLTLTGNGTVSGTWGVTGTTTLNTTIVANITSGPTGYFGVSGRAHFLSGPNGFAAFTNSGGVTRVAVDCAGLVLDKTMTAGGTTGAQTINKYAGSVNFAAAAASLVVTNSLVTTSSIVLATVATNDATLQNVQAVAAAGSFTLFGNAAATAETRVNWTVIN